MNIEKITNRNTNFGMSLKIHPNAKSTLEKQSTKYIDKIQKIGEELKNIDTFDLVLDENLKPSVLKRNGNYDYFKRFRKEVKHAGEHYEVTAGDETVGGYNPLIPDTITSLMDSKDMAKKVYNKMKKLDKLDQAAELVKLLDKNIPTKSKIGNVMNHFEDKTLITNKSVKEKNKNISLWQKISNFFKISNK